MKPDISEFSYGYALTEDLIRWSSTPLSAAPVFPSLIEEGRSGGGYDVRLEFSGIPLFLQFKLSDYLKSRRAREFKENLFTQPFYRMHLRPLRHSDQHNLLLALENTGNEVYYVAPTFHEVSELNQAYISQQVVQRSVFIPPSGIGQLPDNDNHHVSFQLNGDAYFLSKPVPVRVVSGELLGKHLSTKLREREQQRKIGRTCIREW